MCVPISTMARFIWVFFVIASVLVGEPAMGAKTATVSGHIFTMGSDHVQTVWPNARVTLKNLGTNNESATVSDDLGRYTFSGIFPGQYEIMVA